MSITMKRMKLWTLLAMTLFVAYGCRATPSKESVMQQAQPCPSSSVGFSTGFTTTSSATPKPAPRPPSKMHWKRGQYWSFKENSVKDLLVRDVDEAALVEVTYANPSPTETWAVCSGTTGDCYGEFSSRRAAEAKAMEVAVEIDAERPPQK